MPKILKLEPSLALARSDKLDPAEKKPQAEIFEPHLAKDRRDRADPTVTLCATDAQSPTRNLPKIDADDPALANARKLRLLLMVTKSSHDMLEPSLAKLLIEIAEPMLTPSRTLADAEMNTFPAEPIEQPEPTRMKLRSDTDEPTVTKSNTLSLLPRRVKLRTDSELEIVTWFTMDACKMLPHARHPVIDKFDPQRAIVRSETDEPNDAKPNALTADPRRTVQRTDKLEPR